MGSGFAELHKTQPLSYLVGMSDERNKVIPLRLQPRRFKADPSVALEYRDIPPGEPV
jgi:hypothetical protein